MIARTRSANINLQLKKLKKIDGQIILKRALTRYDKAYKGGGEGLDLSVGTLSALLRSYSRRTDETIKLACSKGSHQVTVAYKGPDII